MLLFLSIKTKCIRILLTKIEPIFDCKLFGTMCAFIGRKLN